MKSFVKLNYHNSSLTIGPPLNDYVTKSFHFIFEKKNIIFILTGRGRAFGRPTSRWWWIRSATCGGWVGASPKTRCTRCAACWRWTRLRWALRVAACAPSSQPPTSWHTTAPPTPATRTTPGAVFPSRPASKSTRATQSRSATPTRCRAPCGGASTCARANSLSACAAGAPTRPSSAPSAVRLWWVFGIQNLCHS